MSNFIGSETGFIFVTVLLDSREENQMENIEFMKWKKNDASAM